MNKVIKIIITTIIILSIGLLSYLITNNITTDHIIKNNTIENISVKQFISEFNKNLKEQDLEEQISLDEATADKNNTYWLILNDNFDVVVKVDKVTKNIENDTVRLNGLAYNTEYDEKDEIEKYIKILLKTNNSKLTDETINEMLESVNKIDKSSKEKATSELFEYKGLGIDKTKDEINAMYRIARYGGEK